MTSPIIHELIEHYGLQPLVPEGGFFAETYRSKDIIAHQGLPKGFAGDRSCSTAIYYLLAEHAHSKLHRIKADEVWHFYAGGPLTIVEITEEGTAQLTTLGQDFRKGEKFQHVVPAGRWFGSFPSPGSSYSFVGCTVAPGFDYADFEMGDREKLLRLFPRCKTYIDMLT